MFSVIKWFVSCTDEVLVKESGSHAAHGWGTWQQLLRSMLEVRPPRAVVAVVIYRGSQLWGGWKPFVT